MPAFPASDTSATLQFVRHATLDGGMHIVPGDTRVLFNTDGTSNKFYGFFRFAHVCTSRISQALVGSRLGLCGVTIVPFYGRVGRAPQLSNLNDEWYQHFDDVSALTIGLLDMIAGIPAGGCGGLMHIPTSAGSRNEYESHTRSSAALMSAITAKTRRGYMHASLDAGLGEFVQMRRRNLFGALPHVHAATLGERIAGLADCAPSLAFNLSEDVTIETSTAPPITRQRTSPFPEHIPAQPKKRRRGIQL